MIHLDSVTLRALEPKDIEFLYRFRNDSAITEQLVGFSTGYSVQSLHQWLESHRGRSDEVLWAIALNQNDQCIGHAGLYQIDPRVGKAEFGILIGDASLHGRGIGRQVSAAIVTYAFQQLRLHKVSLTVLATNARARGLYERLGFRIEGTLRDDQWRNGRFIDVVVMSLLESEWRAGTLASATPPDNGA
jgi:RimJ/RimL family protein N-acetyltransferase